MIDYGYSFTYSDYKTLKTNLMRMKNTEQANFVLKIKNLHSLGDKKFST
jgi:hypothetical protein